MIDDDTAEVIVCCGPPKCPFQGLAAVENSMAGCTTCRHIVTDKDGNETEYRLKAN